jgi:hypothetical protein
VYNFYPSQTSEESRNQEKEIDFAVVHENYVNEIQLENKTEKEVENFNPSQTSEESRNQEKEIDFAVVHENYVNEVQLENKTEKEVENFHPSQTSEESRNQEKEIDFTVVHENYVNEIQLNKTLEDEVDDVDPPPIREEQSYNYKDIGMWPVKFNQGDGIREMLVQQGSKAVQNIDYHFKEVERPGQKAKLKGETRKLSKDWFFRTLQNGEKMLRPWMVSIESSCVLLLL